MYFGFWLLDGTNVQFQDSSIQLFPSLTAAADVEYIYTDRLYNAPLSIGGHVWVGMKNTFVLILNIYFHGPASHTLSHSIVGESTVSDKGKVTFENVTVDGSGGYLSVVTNAELEYDGGAFDTFIVMTDKSSYLRFLGTAMRDSKGHSHQMLVGGGTLLLQVLSLSFFLSLSFSPYLSFSLSLSLPHSSLLPRTPTLLSHPRHTTHSQAATDKSHA